MRKWVIKQPYENAPLQVWEYIDSYEEASKYWYVAKAMRDHGVDDVLPIAMNQLGGYHSLKYCQDEIVEIIESDKEPTLDLIKKYPIAKERVANGWMSPECVVYTCNSYGHVGLAEQICDEFYDGPYFKAYGREHPINAPDEKLFDKGWVKIISWKWLGMLRRMTDNQIKRIEELGYEEY